MYRLIEIINKYCLIRIKRSTQHMQNCTLTLLIATFCTHNTYALDDKETIISGRVSKVRDGDTLEISSVPIRLSGISAPELNESGGEKAKFFIVNLVYGKRIQCSLTGEKSYDRFVGTCYFKHQDIGAALIRAGLALDCPKYSDGKYKEFESKASRARIRLPAYCR